MAAVRDPKTILITGASSGIGAALALTYAAPGVRLVLAGRNNERLQDVAEACREKGATAEPEVVDVLDEAKVRAWIERVEGSGPVDIAIANAGVSAGTGQGTEPPDQTERIMSTNIDGVLNTLMPLIPRMQERRRGQLVVISSLAAFRGFPGAPAYCASKAAVRVWGEAMRGHLKPDGLGVTVVCPGYIDTPMTERNDFPMPFLMSAGKAAAIIRRGIERDKARLAFPLRLYAGVWLLQALPPAITDPLLARLPSKV